MKDDKTLLELAENIDIHVDERFFCSEKTSVDFYTLKYDETKGNCAVFFLNGNGDFNKAMEVSFYGLPNSAIAPENLEKFEKILNKMVNSREFQNSYTKYMDLYEMIGQKGLSAGTKILDKFVNLEKEFLKKFEAERKKYSKTFEQEITKTSLVPKKKKVNTLANNNDIDGR